MRPRPTRPVGPDCAEVSRSRVDRRTTPQPPDLVLDGRCGRRCRWCVLLRCHGRLLSPRFPVCIGRADFRGI